jgi:hypothetical protein
MKKKKLLIVLAAVATAITTFIMGGPANVAQPVADVVDEVVVDNVQALVVGEVAEAGLFYCSAKRNFNVTTSICEGVTAGGSQHQRAYTTCFYYVPYGWRTYYGDTVGVLETSRAVAASGGSGCYGGYQLRP